VDVVVGVAAALVTAAGNWDRVAPWLPRGTIVPLAIGQGLLLLARRWAPAAVLAAVTLVGVFMLAVGYPPVAAGFATCCAAYALAVYGRRAEGTELAGGDRLGRGHPRAFGHPATAREDGRGLGRGRGRRTADQASAVRARGRRAAAGRPRTVKRRDRREAPPGRDYGESHVQSLLGKLGVRDRLQAAVAAYDSGLVRPHGP
jgi:hypothetical protein